MDEDRRPIILSILKPTDDVRVDLRDRKVAVLLVRSFTDTCLDAFRAALGDEQSQDDAVEQISRFADVLNDVFLGQSGLEPIAETAWNTPEGLGAHLCAMLDLDGPADQAVRALMIRIATAVMTALQRRQGDWPQLIEDLVAEAGALLIGQPPEFPAVRPEASS